MFVKVKCMKQMKEHCKPMSKLDCMIQHQKVIYSHFLAKIFRAWSRDNPPFCDDDVSAGFNHRNSVWIQQLSVAFSNFTKLKLEPALLVEDLDSVVVGVGHNDVVLSIDRHSTRLCELSLKNSELSKLAVIDHLLSFDLGLERIESRAAACVVAVVDGGVVDGSAWWQGRGAETGL